ncbi:interferon-induced protein 44-like [Mercenaria mercenaria]|uniref:interferon-induced protein 44-like n=1 Tax=Mercenaria mercenaria TaxID=6596 RepID=UPI00234E5A1C|nr:interferon-induced protein 44-like [Mercenaria mercenaria]XP_053377088.1 interferon-induced protein 44-like [Mercenaria mercenaria]
MTGRLTEKDMDQLEKWINTGPKSFTLLYAISRDGCSPESFHRKCDNQGPTVTVIHNQQGSIFGGYTRVSWQNVDQYFQDNTAFLFQLQFNDKTSYRKFPVVDASCATFSYTTGPTFGDGPDLRTFTSVVYNSGGNFALNGCMNVGCSYDVQEIHSDQINNGNMNATELEVYKVTDDQREKKNIPKPWRNTSDWNRKFLEELKSDIATFKPNADPEVTATRILMIGPVGAGKSSFYNTIDTVFRGRITQLACSGSAEKSLTTNYTTYTLNDHHGTPLHFRLCGTRGMEEQADLNDTECNYLLSGNVPNHYKFDPNYQISSRTRGFIHRPTANDRVHCVVFVLDATTMDVLSTDLLENMKVFQRLAKAKEIPQTIVLAKVDRLCKDVKKDISFVHTSQIVEQHVDKASNLLGLPRANVFPLKNYENEVQLDDNISILALLSLRQMLYFSEDYTSIRLEKQRAEAELARWKLPECRII